MVFLLFYPRSWKGHLSSLYGAATRFCAPNLIVDASLPWYHYLLHLEHHKCPSLEASETSLFQEAIYLVSNSRGKSHENTNEKDRPGKTLCLGGLPEDTVKLECKSVTGFSALFTITSDNDGLTLALWDLETQEVLHSHMGKNSVFVECSQEQQLCLILSGESLSL